MRKCFLFGAFVFLFLLVFQPFGLSGLEEGILRITLGYGLTTFFVMLFLNVFLPPLFRKFFNEEKWTVGHEIFWNIVNIGIIGLGNALFSALMEFIPLSVKGILIFELYTLLVAFFPVLISTLFNESRLNRKFDSASRQINEVLNEQPAINDVPGNNGDVVILIPSESGTDAISLNENELIYIRSSDNYVEVFYENGSIISKKLLRNSLKSISEKLQQNKKLFRCHKSFLVNLEKVKKVSGNAQGYKLHLKNTEEQIPVSRQHNKEIRERLSAIHEH